MKVGPLEINIFKEPKKNVELGKSGTTIFNGQISDEDYNIKLSGSRAIAIYDKMRKSK